MFNKLIVRTQKNQFAKAKPYRIIINGAMVGEINKVISKTEFELPIGKHLIEISDGENKVSKEIIFTVNQFKVISIVPSLFKQGMVGFSVGASICLMLISIFTIFYFDFSSKFFPVFLLALLLPIVSDLKRCSSEADFKITIVS
jgi:hypothetical protein